MRAPIGLLYSQVGYDAGAPKRVLVRGPKRCLTSKAQLLLLDQGKTAWKGPLVYWGELWGSAWWVADFSAFKKIGSYDVIVREGKKIKLRGEQLKIGKGILFKETFEPVALRQYSLRAVFAQVSPGWFDAGMLWQEVPSHAVSIVGLSDLLIKAGKRLTRSQKNDLYMHLENGGGYLWQCQLKAQQLGYNGAVVHDLAKAPDRVCSNDAFMAAIAWCKAAAALQAEHPLLAKLFAVNAAYALDWIEKEAQPVDATHNMNWNQGWPEGKPWPKQWMTRYLMLALWCELLLKADGHRDREDRIETLTRQILARQVPMSKAEAGYWGHFYAYDAEGEEITEKGWSHGMPPHQNGQNKVFGSDMGAVFAYPLHAFIEGLQLFPKHKLAGEWRRSIESFALGYFKPACSANPFYLAPRGVYGKEGLLHFSGLWHGCNTLYGQAAALALEFEKLLPDPAWRQIAIGNLQWICGLNVGLTQEAADLGCVMRKHVVPKGQALPVSMIYDVGHRTAGNWTTIQGSVCNGFSAGAQFTYDVAPLKKLDAPTSLTDEDWITHAGGYLMGLARL